MANEKVKSYFKDYPVSDKCFETADGTLFHQEGDANHHQTGTLKSNEPVKKHYRNAVPVTDSITASETNITDAVEDALTGEETLIGEDAGQTEPVAEPVKKKPAAKAAAKKKG